MTNAYFAILPSDKAFKVFKPLFQLYFAAKWILVSEVTFISGKDSL